MIKGLKVIINKNIYPNFDVLTELFDNTVNNLPNVEYKSFFYFYGSDLGGYYEDKKKVQSLLLSVKNTSEENEMLETMTKRMMKAKEDYEKNEEALSQKAEIEKMLKNKVLQVSKKFDDVHFLKMHKLYETLTDPVLEIPIEDFPQKVKDFFDLQNNNSVPMSVFGKNNINGRYCDLLYQTYSENNKYDFLLIDDDVLNKNNLVYNGDNISLDKFHKIKKGDYYILDINGFCANSM